MDISTQGVKKDFYKIMQDAIYGTNIGDEIVSDNWEYIYDELLAQTVVALPVNHMPKTMPEEIKRKIIANSRKTFMQWCSLAIFQQEIVDLFEKSNIEFCIIKGYAAAINYPEPYYRGMGDIDILVSNSSFDKACTLLTENGFIENGDGDRHVEFSKYKYEVEIHRFFSSVREDPFNDYLLESIVDCERVELEGFIFPILPIVQNGLIFLEHIKQHLVGGLGFRQIIDWMVFADKHLNDEFWYNSFYDKACQYGLEKLAITVTYACQKYMGLNNKITWCKGADEKLVESLMDFIFENGNFGRKMVECSGGQYLFASASEGTLFKKFQTRGVHNWKALKKHPKLKSFAWIYQICRYIKLGFSRQNPFKKLAKDYKESKRQMSLIDSLFTGRK